MKYYIDISLLPDAEATSGFIWEKMFQQIHLALAAQSENGASAVAIAFPGYGKGQFPLGGKLRLLSRDEATLQQLNISHWLSRLTDYVHITSIRPIPEKVKGHSIYKRLQPKSSSERLARRKAKREGITFEQAMAALSGRKDVHVKTPFINMIS
ncbi:MAG: type I-F CRISPR-associated endoribonuclease Cas6/Csy4, partial [Bacteroidales bacterium]